MTVKKSEDGPDPGTANNTLGADKIRSDSACRATAEQDTNTSWHAFLCKSNCSAILMLLAFTDARPVRVAQKSMMPIEEAFIKARTDVLERSITMQVSQLESTQRLSWSSLTWLKHDAVSLGRIMYKSVLLSMSFQAMLVRLFGINPAEEYFPFLYDRDGVIVVQWARLLTDIKVKVEGMSSYFCNNDRWCY